MPVRALDRGFIGVALGQLIDARQRGVGDFEAGIAFDILAFPLFETESMNNPRQGQPLKNQR